MCKILNQSLSDIEWKQTEIYIVMKFFIVKQDPTQEHKEKNHFESVTENGRLLQYLMHLLQWEYIFLTALF